MPTIVVPLLRTPAPDDPDLIRFAATLRSDNAPLCVKMAGQLRPNGNCYWNVARVVLESGGSIQFGWQFFAWPGLYIEAMHHAVWRTAGNRPIDVTEKYPTDPVRSHSVFLCDDQSAVPLDRLANVTTQFHLLVDQPAVRAHVEAYRAKNTAEREYGNRLWEIGYRCENQMALAAGEDATPVRLSRRVAAELDHLRSRIDAAKFAVGTSIDTLRALDAGRQRSVA